MASFLADEVDEEYLTTNGTDTKVIWCKRANTKADVSK
jgi:hypothetical protein